MAGTEIAERCLRCGDPVKGTDRCDRCRSSPAGAIPERASLVGQVAYGLAAPFRGLRFAVPGHGVSRYFVLPVVINAVVFGLLLAGALIGIDALYDRYGPSEEAAWASILEAAIFVLFIGAYLLFVFFAFNVLGPVIAGPFLEPLSAAVEREVLGGARAEIGVGGVLREAVWSVRQAIGMLGIALAAATIALPLALCVPVVGQPLAVAVTAWAVALEYLDAVLARKRYPLRGKIAFVRSHLASTLGLGLAVYLLLLVPFLNLLLIPASAAGATLLYLDADK